jgi:DNA-binding response OmpR family regulator
VKVIKINNPIKTMTDLLYQENRHSILMVDDDAEHRTMMGLMLSAEGYLVQHAKDGQHAVVLHRNKPFDLVIAELVQEDRNGFQTLMDLRRHSAQVKIIATARMNWIPDEHCLRMAGHLGAHSVLSKPFPPEALLNAVRTALE